ncbi:hypothetical protein V8C42DRAFT_333989 [Trichoderma barbatum]
MSNITLFTDSRVPCPQRMLLTIHELGLQIKDIREVDISKFEHKRPEILELNPFGAVPFIRDETYEPPLMLAESPRYCKIFSTRIRQQRCVCFTTPRSKRCYCDCQIRRGGLN